MPKLFEWGQIYMQVHAGVFTCIKDTEIKLKARFQSTKRRCSSVSRWCAVCTYETLLYLYIAHHHYAPACHYMLDINVLATEYNTRSTSSEIYYDIIVEIERERELSVEFKL